MMPALALAVVAASIPIGLLVAIVSRRVGAGIPAMLDLWIAAGLLRLSYTSSWSAIAGAAALIAIRKVVVAAFAQNRSQTYESSTTG